MASCAHVTMLGQFWDSFEKFTWTFSVYLSLILFYDDKAEIDTLMSAIVSYMTLKARFGLWWALHFVRESHITEMTINEYAYLISYYRC